MAIEDSTNEFLSIFLEEAVDILSDWEKHCLALQVNPDPATCSALFRSAHNLKGSARSVGLAEFGKFIHLAEDVITLIRDGKLLPSSSTINILLNAQSVLSDWRDKLTSDPRFVPQSEVDKISIQLNEVIGSIQGKEINATAAFGFFDDEPPQQVAIVPKPKRIESEQKGKATSNESIRIPASRIDGLMQLIGELSIQQSTILHALKNNSMHEPICHKAVHIASKLTRELQMQTMSLRLVDLGKLFQKLERTARDLAGHQKKEIQFVQEGSEVELDKNVIERVSDALVHMIRNSVDHGIENPGERGDKPACANIVLKAFQSASGVTIQISDDGRGINAEKVLNKAKSMNLVPEGSQLPPEKIYEFLFTPGFSTASKVTEISGRGVGLDVVKRTIDDLGGNIEIQSEFGKGTTFSISIPLTVSIVDSLTIVSGGYSYVVPIQEISEVIDMRSFQSEIQHNQAKTISLRDKSLTIRPLSMHLPIRSSAASSSREVPSNEDVPHPVMVIEVEGQRMGFSFDSILGQQPIVIRQLAEYIANVPGFSGNTVLANGDPAIIVSPKVFARQYLNSKVGA